MGKISNQKYPIVGVQFFGEDGLNAETATWAMEHVSGFAYDFARIDGEFSSAYFVFNSEVYAALEERCLIVEFEAFIRTILNDVANESENDEYQYAGYTFCLVYEYTYSGKATIAGS